MNRTHDKLIRVLGRGGMLILGAEGYRVYRSQDGRRGCVGVLPHEQFERLFEEGALVRLCQTGERWALCEDCNLVINKRPSPAAVSPLKPRNGRSATVLEAALKGVDNRRDAERLASAAMRFLRDYEALSSGPSVTMNWAFELSSNKGVYGGGQTGLPPHGLSAQAALRDIGAALGERQFALIECTLVKQYTQRRLSGDFGLSIGGMLEAVRQSLVQMADAYDLIIRADA